MSDIKNELNLSTIEMMTKVKDSAYKILGQYKVGEKTTLRDLIDKVVADTNIQVSIANGLVPMIVREWESLGNGTINRGRGGGIWIGGKPERVDTRPRCETCGQVYRPKQ